MSDARASRRPPATRLDRVLCLVVLALLGIVVFRLQQADPEEKTVDQRQEILAVADEVALRLTSMTRTSIETDLDSFLALTTGDLRRSFESQSELFSNLIKDSKVQSDGAVVAHGIVESDAGSAEVLVATSAQVRNKQTPKGETRQYRMRIVLVHVDDEWRAESLELVA